MRTIGDMDGAPVGRRVFLGLAAFGVSGIVWGSKAAGFMERLLAPVSAKDGSGLLGLLPIGRFRIYSVIGTLPDEPTSKWQLTVDGLADKPYTIGWDDLLAMPPVEISKDFQCVTGWRVPQVPWTGVTLSTILDAVGVSPGAAAVTFTSFDNVSTESL